MIYIPRAINEIKLAIIGKLIMKCGTTVSIVRGLKQHPSGLGVYRTPIE